MRKMQFIWHGWKVVWWCLRHGYPIVGACTCARYGKTYREVWCGPLEFRMEVGDAES